MTLLDAVAMGWCLIQDAMIAFLKRRRRRKLFELYKLGSWVPQEIRVDVDEEGYWIKH